MQKSKSIESFLGPVLNHEHCLDCQQFNACIEKQVWCQEAMLRCLSAALVKGAQNKTKKGEINE